MSIGIPIPPPTEPQDPGVTIDSTPTEPAPPTEPTAPAPEPIPTPSPLPPSSGGAGDLSNIAWILLALAFLLLAIAWVNLINWMSRSLWRMIGRGGSAPQLDRNKTAQGLSNWIGTAVAGIDSEVGYSFTASGKTIGLLGATLTRLHIRVHTLASKVSAVEHATNTTRAAQQAIRGQLTHEGASITGLQSQTASIQATAEARAKTTDERLHGLEQHITTLIEPELARLRSQIPELSRGHTDNRKRLDTHDSMLTDTAILAGVAAGLAKLGGSWVRCDNNQQLGKAQCGLPDNLLKDLLSALTVLGLGTFSLVELARWEQTVVGEAKDAVAAFWRVPLPKS